MKEIRTFLENHKDRFLNELLELLRIPSVSAVPAHKPDMRRCAEHLKNSFQALDLPVVEICETAGHPIVYAETEQLPERKTILVYGHYDVQPAEPLELWESAPFEPVIKKTNSHPEGVIYARGASDDKGQMFMHLKAYEIMQSMGDLPCNIKFLIEGEEEVGSLNLEPFIQANKERLKCDVILVSDTSILANETPSITCGLRGMTYLEVKVTGPNRDLHSGIYGGAVDNPINTLCELLASLKDKDLHITIPGFYDDVVELSLEEREKMAERPHNQQAYCDTLGIGATRGEKGYTVIEQISIRPTLDVNGIWGGYIGKGAKTVLPSHASAKISMRLVPNQNSNKILDLFQQHFESIAPSSVKVEVLPHHGGEPSVTPIDSIGFKAASAAMKETFGQEPIPTREGGSIPIVSMFEKELGVNTVLMGFGLNSDAIHSPNEHFGLFNFFRGIETIPGFHYHFAKMSKQVPVASRVD